LHPAAAAQAELCGRTFASVPELLAQLERDPRYVETPGPEIAGRRPLRWLVRRGDEGYEDWLVTPPGHPLFPAASCSARGAPIRESAHLRMTYCGRRGDACARFVAFLRQRDLMPRAAN
jgi:hypothetical protein